VAIVAAFGGHWVVRLNQGGGYAAMVVFLVLGLALLFPSLAEILTRPLLRVSSRLIEFLDSGVQAFAFTFG
jgi:hypothetical protein